MDRMLRMLPCLLVLWMAMPVELWADAPVPAADSAMSLVTPVKKKRFGDSRDRVNLELASSIYAVRPGDHVVVAIVMDHQQGWHSHTNNPKVPPELGKADDYIKTQVKLDAKAGVTDGNGAGPVHVFMDAIQWPAVHETNVMFGGEAVKYGVFEGRSITFVPVTIDAGATDGEYEVAFQMTFQSCDRTSCIPPAFNVKLSTKLKVLASSPPAGDVKKEGDFAAFDDTVFARLPKDHSDAATMPAVPETLPIKRPVTGPDERVRFAFFGFDFMVDPTAAYGIWIMMGLAVVGGFMLNFTPCVLPVIPIKMISLSRNAGNRARCFWLGSIMSLGVVLFWLGLGIAIALTASLLTSHGETGGITSANQLFQKPAFTIAVGVVVSVMAIGMCGLFAVRLPQFIYNFTPKHDSLLGSMGMGVMTAILSTPCTAPFMGAAAAWAVGVGPKLTLLIFAAIGAGMALPYLLLSAFPSAVAKMPRTGPASELIKQVMGLLMLAAGAYFIGTGLSGALVDPPQPPTREYWWGVAAFVVAAGLWLGWRTVRITPRWGPRVLWCAVGLALAIGAVNVARSATERGPTMWVYYTPDLFKQAQAKNKIIVMDFTAEWCLNCKVLEKNVLESKSVSALLDSSDVVPMKVDLTGNNTEGNDMLHSVDRVTIPLLVVFDKSGQIVFKSDAYTADQVIDAVKKAGG